MASGSTNSNDNNKYPPFAFSTWDRPVRRRPRRGQSKDESGSSGSRGSDDGAATEGKMTVAYKVLNPPAGKGARTPLVLVHGLSAVGLVDWLPLAQELAKTRKVLIFDNRNIGFSRYLDKSMDDDEYGMDDLADNVIELVKHVGWDEIDLLGFSMGGMIAQSILVAPRLPFKVRHVVLAATSAKPAHSDLLQAIPQAPEGTLTLEQKKALVRPFVEVGYDPTFLSNPKNESTIEERVLQSIHTRRPAKTVAHQVKAIAGYDVRKRMASIPSTLPVLVLHGTLDRSVYFTESKYITKGLPQAQLHVFEGIGHSWYDYFTIDYWTGLLNEFLEDKPLRAPLSNRKPKL